MNESVALLPSKQGNKAITWQDCLTVSMVTAWSIVPKHSIVEDAVCEVIGQNSVKLHDLHVTAVLVNGDGTIVVGDVTPHVHSDVQGRWVQDLLSVHRKSVSLQHRVGESGVIEA